MLVTTPGRPAAMSRLDRCVRAVGLTRNPLRRPSDKIEARTTLILLGLVVLVGPVLGWQTGRAAYRDGVATERSQVGYSRVPAVLVDEAKAAVVDGSAVPSSVLVDAMWTAPNGSVRTGT